jgi:hypothetical protein
MAMIRTFKLLLLLAAALTNIAHAADLPHSPFYTENIAVFRLLKRMDVAPMARTQLAQPPASADANLQQVMRYMSKHASDDDIYRALAPSYGRYVDINEANRLSTSAPDAKAFAGLNKKVQAGFPREVSEWARTYYLAQLFEGMRTIYLRMQEHQPGTPLPDLSLKSSGMAAVDKPLALMAEVRVQSAGLDQAMEDASKDFEQNNPLEPKHLVSAAGLAQGKAALKKMEDQIEHYLTDRAQLQNSYRQRMEQLVSDTQLRTSMELGWSLLYDSDLAYAERERTALAIIRRMVNFAESRLGKIHFEDDQLVFEDDEDIDLYNAMVDQLERKVEETK